MTFSRLICWCISNTLYVYQSQWLEFLSVVPLRFQSHLENPHEPHTILWQIHHTFLILVTAWIHALIDIEMPSKCTMFVQQAVVLATVCEYMENILKKQTRCIWWLYWTTWKLATYTLCIHNVNETLTRYCRSNPLKWFVYVWKCHIT